MRRKQYLELRASLETEVMDLESRAAESRERLEALDLVWSTVLNGGNQYKVTTVSYSPARRGSMAALIDEAIADVPLLFTVEDVVGAIRCRLSDKPDAQINRSTISGRLRRLTEDTGFVEIHRPGRGRQATVYRKESDSGQEQESVMPAQ